MPSPHLPETEVCERHVVLVTPQVHWNTGNVGRTCLGAGACLHLIRPLGFILDDRRIRRAGLDYWPRVRLSVWNDFNHFYNELKPDGDEIALLTKSGRQPYWLLPKTKRLFMVFGSETQGLPRDLISAFPNQTYHIPIQTEIRCLNLSTAVGIVLYDSLRPQLTHLSL